MSGIGTIVKMVKEKNEAVAKLSTDIVETYGEKLREAYGITFEQPDVKIEWGAITQLGGHPDILVVPGKIIMDVGDIVVSEDKKIVITEENRTTYSELATFMFPVIMIEVATAKELSEYMNLVFIEGGKAENKDSEFIEFVIKQGTEFEESLLNDSDRLDALTKDKFIGGFDIEKLTPDQIRQLRWYTENPLHTIN